MVAGAHDVAGEQRDVVGHAARHPAQRQVGVRDEQQLRLGALELAEQLAVPEDAAVVALVEEAAGAEEAVVAGRAVGAEDAVADRDAADVVAGGDDGADVLVADREPGLDRDPPVEDVEVGAADAARLDLDDRLAGRRELRIGLLVDPDLARGLEGDRSHRGHSMDRDPEPILSAVLARMTGYEEAHISRPAPAPRRPRDRRRARPAPEAAPR